MIYPWHQAAWQQMAAQLDRLPSAWLIYGQEHIGKTAFAEHLARVLLCEAPQGQVACEQCASCHLSKTASHPDFYRLPTTADAQEGKLAIRVADIRAVIDAVRLTPLRAPRRVVLIDAAQNMNVQAANALLKILEEPSASVVFILVTAKKDRLLATIKSRCRPFFLPSPSTEEALDYLKTQQQPLNEARLAFYGGSPLVLPDDSDDEARDQLVAVLLQPRILALLDYASWYDKQKKPLAFFLDCFDKWLIDMIAIRNGQVARFYPQAAAKMAAMAARYEVQKLFFLRDKILALVPFGQHPLNVKLVLEDVLIQYLTLPH